jgi:hypothetical protein
MFGKLAAAVALVQVKAGLVARGDVQAQLPAVFANDDLGVRRPSFGMREGSLFSSRGRGSGLGLS